MAASSDGEWRPLDRGQLARWTLSGALRVVGGDERAPHLLRHEGAEGRDQQRDGRQALVEGVERGDRVVPAAAGPVLAAPAAPEPAAPRPDVPVAQVVDQLLQQAARAGGVEVLEALGHAVHGPVEPRQDPAVDRAQVVRLGRRSARRPPIGQRRVRDQEGVRVPERQQEPAHRLVDRLQAEAERVPRALRGEQVPAERVGALAVEDGPGLDDVALALAHLLALAVEDEPQAHHVAVRRPVEQQRALRQQRVEPAARLVEGLADEVGRAPSPSGRRPSRTGGGPARTASRRCRTRRR